MPSDLKVGKHEAAAWVCESLPQSRDAEALTRGSPHKDVDGSWLNIPLLELGHVPKVGNGRKPMRQHGARERFDLAEADWLPAEVMPRD